MLATLPVRLAGRAAGAGLGAASAVGTVVRRSRPLHPRGALLAATVRRHGAPVPWGVPWLDEPGEDEALVRVSRSVGLPAPWPDVLGLALRVPVPGAAADDVDEVGDGDGGPRQADLLFATTGLGTLGRFLFAPRRELAASPLSTLLPYRSPRGLVVLAATPADPGRPLPRDPDELAAVAAAEPVELVLEAAAPTGPWRAFGLLLLTGPAEASLDPPTAFDPVRRPLPGLEVPTALARLREPAYALAQRLRHAPSRARRPS
ncbi:MAG TPA: hypothetical protein VFS29_03330 [Motilibacteraceae bacterium]|nr:hypothetical protein [Motilibacteraceae bacterium]